MNLINSFFNERIALANLSAPIWLWVVSFAVIVGFILGIIWFYRYIINLIKKISSLAFIGLGKFSKSAQAKLLRSVIFTSLKVLFIIFIINQLGFNISSILTFFGAAGISLSIALKDDLENLSSGISMIYSGKVKINEEIEVKDVKGKVKDISLMHSVIESGNKRYLVPNSYLSKNVIVKEIK